MVSRFYHSSFHRTCCVTLKITSTNNFETNGAPQSSPLSFTTELKIGTWILCSVPRVCSKTKTLFPGNLHDTQVELLLSLIVVSVGGFLRAFFLDRTSMLQLSSFCWRTSRQGNTDGTAEVFNVFLQPVSERI